MKKLFIAICGLALVLSSCKKPDNRNSTTPYLVFKLKLDSTQVRLDNLGNPVPNTDSTESCTPIYHGISANSIELSPNQYTPLNAGDVVYNMPTTIAGGEGAIDFSQEVIVNDGDVIFKIPLSSVTPGTYQYLRVSVAYQNYTAPLYIDTTFNYLSFPITIQQTFPCVIASFVGMNTYIPSYHIDDTTINVNANKLQGYWGARVSGNANVNVMGYDTVVPFKNFSSGQAVATTVSNPLFATSPIPTGSCIATGGFPTDAPLIITGNETADITVQISLSINHSFEWKKVNADGKWEPFIGENVVDMGIRGLIPSVIH